MRPFLSSAPAYARPARSGRRRWLRQLACWTSKKGVILRYGRHQAEPRWSRTQLRPPPVVPDRDSGQLSDGERSPIQGE